MTDYTQEQAERIGHEAVALGFRVEQGRHATLPHKETIGRTTILSLIPDPRDPLTAKAFELWVEDVAREVRGGDGPLRFEWDDINQEWFVTIPMPWDSPDVVVSAPTGPEACIAAIKAMREGE